MLAGDGGECVDLPADALLLLERDDVMEVENYMAREQSGSEGTDPTAPKPAGA